MSEGTKISWHDLLETLAGEGSKEIIHRRTSWKRKATPVVRDLASLSSFTGELLQETGCQLVELRMEDLHAGKWTFIEPSRRSTASRNIKKGCSGFTLIQGHQILGDMGCNTPPGGGHGY